MNLIRDTFSEKGIFGTLCSEDDQPICKTLEHAYPDFGGKWKAKIPGASSFQCVRGIHRQADGFPFETFEVVGIEGHEGILFHPGNHNEDSSGCILVGEAIQNYTLTKSRTAFLDLMNRLRSVESFVLNVIGG